MKSTLRIDFQEGDLPSLHPHDLIIYLRGISIGKTLFEGLTRIDEMGKAQLAGAKSVNISPDGLFYTFKLRKNCWSDGTPVTAFQYEKAWREALSPVSPCKRADLLYIVKHAQEVKRGEEPIESLGIRALDSQTVLIELVRPSPHFLDLLAQPICAPLKESEMKTVTHFNGPFTVDQWERGSFLRLKPNPYFWNREHVSLPQLEIYMVQDQETAYTLYEQKQIDWIGVPLCPLSVEQIDHLKEKQFLQSYPVERVFWVFLNTQHEALSSPFIRKALSCAIKREKITQNILVGGDPLNKSLPYALLPRPSNATIEEDPVHAKELFERGLKQLGLTRETFPPLIITYSQQANRKQLAEYLQQTWSQVLGIEVQLQAQEWNVLRTNLGTGQFEITGCFEASYCHDPLELMDRMVTLNSSNFSQWIFPLYQQKIASASREVDVDHRLALLSEAEDILIDQMPLIPISSDRFLFAHNPKLRGYAFDSVGAVDFSYSAFK